MVDELLMEVIVNRLSISFYILSIYFLAVQKEMRMRTGKPKSTKVRNSSCDLDSFHLVLNQNRAF